MPSIKQQFGDELYEHRQGRIGVGVVYHAAGDVYECRSINAVFR
jgi:hypothetical protein